MLFRSVLWDKFAVRDSVYLDIRTSIPAWLGADSVWQQHYGAKLAGVIRSFRVGGRPVFPPAQPANR